MPRAKLPPAFDHDAALVACTRGDRDGLRRLYAQESARLWPMLARMLHTHEDSDEALRRTFGLIWAQADSLRTESGAAADRIFALARQYALAMPRAARGTRVRQEDLKDTVRLKERLAAIWRRIEGDLDEAPPPRRDWASEIAPAAPFPPPEPIETEPAPPDSIEIETAPPPPPSPPMDDGGTGGRHRSWAAAAAALVLLAVTSLAAMQVGFPGRLLDSGDDDGDAPVAVADVAEPAEPPPVAPSAPHRPDAADEPDASALVVLSSLPPSRMAEGAAIGRRSDRTAETPSETAPSTLPQPRRLEAEPRRLEAESRGVAPQPRRLEAERRDAAPRPRNVADVVTIAPASDSSIETAPVLEGLRVFIHHTNTADRASDLAHDLAEDLRAQGAAPVAVRPVEFVIGSANIRYFHDDDQAAGRALQRRLGNVIGADNGPAAARLRDFSHLTPKPRPGTFEVWLATDLAGPG